VKGSAIEENFKRLKTLNSKFNQPFGKVADAMYAILEF